MKPRNVLIFPAGTEIGLEIYQALQFCKEVRLFGAGQDGSNHAKFAYPEYYVLPSIYEEGWLNSLTKLCKSLDINYIFPAYDDIIVALSRNADKLPAALISSPSYACEVTRSKSETYRVLAGKIRVPQIYVSKTNIEKYPVLVKPDRGQGSFGITKVSNETDLTNALQTVPNPLICEYLPGEEYTIDCFSDRDKGVLFTGARVRRRTRNGISVNSITVDLPQATDMAHKIGDALGLRGAWFFQLKRDSKEELTLLEVAPRVAGSMATHRVSGVNFPLLSIFEEERLPISIMCNNGVIEIDRALKNRYKHSVEFSTLYIDLDDTLLINGKVNISALRLVFQCINAQKKVILITKHRGNLNQILRQHRLSELFDEVIHINESERKSTYISNIDSIFVDDSFSERFDVFRRCEIPTFDCSMIELLIDQSESQKG